VLSANSASRRDVFQAAQVRAGRFLLAAGLLGVLALFSLVGAVVGRIVFADESAQRAGFIVNGFWDALFRGHDLAGIAQFLLMVPAVFALDTIVRSDTAGPSSLLARFGAAAFGLAALSLVLVFLTKASDMLYMLPQGAVGVWLLRINRLGPIGLRRSLRALGAVSGIGLLAVGISAIGVAVALGPKMMSIIGPIPTRVDAAAEQSTLNIVSHVFIMLGTLLGVLTFPVWSILAGRKLLTSAAGNRR
jgi:hypothetical protein